MYQSVSVRNNVIMAKYVSLLFVLLAGCTPGQIPPTSFVLPQPTSIQTSDVEFDLAVQQAHDTLDMFVEHFNFPADTQTLTALKVRITYEDGFSEDIWFDTLKYKSEIFYGMINDGSAHSRTLRPGKFIQLPEKDMIDWMIVENGKLLGGYTIRLAYQRMTAEEKQRFINTLDFTIEP